MKMEEIIAKAKAGNAEAQAELALMFYYGHGIQEDNIKALEWFTKAAEKGHADAQWWLGNMYQHGQGVPQDRREAVDWYTKAAGQGRAGAQEHLATMTGDLDLESVIAGFPGAQAEFRDWVRRAEDAEAEVERLREFEITPEQADAEVEEERRMLDELDNWRQRLAEAESEVARLRQELVSARTSTQYCPCCGEYWSCDFAEVEPLCPECSAEEAK